MSNDTNIKKLIQNLAGDKNAEFYSKPGEVISVNGSKRNCVVQPYDGSAKIYNVRLQAVEDGTTGVFTKPKVGSSVIVSFLSKNFAFVSLTTDIDEIIIKTPKIDIENSDTFRLKSDKIVFNEGGLGGVPISGKVAERIARLEQQLIALCALFDAHTHLVIVPVPGTPSAPPLPLMSPVIPPQLAPPTISAYLENNKVKQ